MRLRILKKDQARIGRGTLPWKQIHPTPTSRMQSHLLGLSAILALALPSSAATQEIVESAPITQAEASQADQISSAIGEFNVAYTAYREAWGAATTNPERKRIAQEQRPDASVVAETLLSAVQLDPSTSSAVEALNWIIIKVPRSPIQSDALGQLAEHHAGASVARDLLKRIAYRSDLASESFAQAVLAAATEPAHQAAAHLTLGRILNTRWKLAKNLAASGGDTTGIYLGGIEPELLENLKGLDAAGIAGVRTKALACFDTIVDMPELAAASNSHGTFGEQAAPVLFEARFLSVGQVAPNIEGHDSTGVAFDLSGYRGQVVLLDFWGDW